VQLPLPAPFRLTTADLRDLLRWRHAPWETPRLRDDLRAFLAELTRQRFYDFCAERIAAGQAVLLLDEYGQEYRIAAAQARRGGEKLILATGRIELRSAEGQLRTIYEAERIELTTVPLPSRTLVTIRLVQTPSQDVLERDLGAGLRGSPRHKPTLNLDQVLVPQAIHTEMERYTPAAILDPQVELPMDRELGDRRIGLQKQAQQLGRKIVATINFRMGYTSSVLVTLLMGAALGVIFRGSRALAAFALAMIPFFSVLVLLVLGRQLTEDRQTTQIGPVVSWGGLLLMLLADGLIVRLGVRR